MILLIRLLILLLICNNVIVFGQNEKSISKCKLDNPPILRGFSLGQSVVDINKVIPSFSEKYRKEKQLKADDTDFEIGWIFMSSIDLFYVDNDNSTVARIVPKEEFEDVNFIWHFRGGKVIFLTAQYLEYEPQNLQTFINQVAEKINLPKQNWKIRDKYNASLLCNGFEVYISTGLDVGRPLYKTEPSVMLTDTIAEAELNK